MESGGNHAARTNKLKGQVMQKGAKELATSKVREMHGFTEASKTMGK
jgi:acid phosphatase family membrane protein YuiD